MAEFGGGVIVDWWKGKVSEYPPALFYNIHKMLLGPGRCGDVIHSRRRSAGHLVDLGCVLHKTAPVDGGEGNRERWPARKPQPVVCWIPDSDPLLRP